MPSIIWDSVNIHSEIFLPVASKLLYTIFAANASPAIPGVSMVPERIPPWCPPPHITGSIFVPVLMYKTPTPFGPWNLCPLILNKSAPKL